jgi:transcriptional regulator with XRE-family HTH domain
LLLVGKELRKNRERAGFTQARAAQVLACTQTKINYLETGRNAPRPSEVEALLRAYDTDEREIKRVTALAKMAGWDAPGHRFKDVLPEWSRILVDLEYLADEVFCYQPLVLPGQLRTPEYAAALLAGHPRVRPMSVADTMEITIARQRLRTSEPLRFQAVIEEYVLDRVVGGPSVMRGQLQHLRAMMRLDTVEVRVMAAEVATHAGLDGAFQLLEVDGVSSIYIEYLGGAVHLHEPDQVELYTLAAKRLRADALSPAESAAAVERRIAEL